MPADSSQIVMMSGCDTYHVGQAFKENPNKRGLINLDVITTTSFTESSDDGPTRELINALIPDERGDFQVATYGKLMNELNISREPLSPFEHFTMYGVHGIDDNMTRNPLGDPDQAGCHTSCSGDSQCGALGNVCAKLTGEPKFCAVECVHSEDCGADMVCEKVGAGFSYSSEDYAQGMACVPSTLTCSGS